MPQPARTIICAGKPICFELRHSRRKSLAITVAPGGAVVVRAPLRASESRIMDFVRQRARWIEKQLRYFDQFEPRTPPRRFVGGESHLYLGRQYRLKIHPCGRAGVLLKRGFFHVHTPDKAPAHIAALLDAWYRRRAAVYFAGVLQTCWQRFPHEGMAKPALTIRNMKTRWGSLSAKTGMTLNLQLIKAPGECIEYVVTHELCHLAHPRHNKAFYRLLEASLPDWEKRKHKLEVTLA